MNEPSNQEFVVNIEHTRVKAALTEAFQMALNFAVFDEVTQKFRLPAAFWEQHGYTVRVEVFGD